MTAIREWVRKVFATKLSAQRKRTLLKYAEISKRAYARPLRRDK